VFIRRKVFVLTDPRHSRSPDHGDHPIFFSISVISVNQWSDFFLFSPRLRVSAVKVWLFSDQRLSA